MKKTIVAACAAILASALTVTVSAGLLDGIIGSSATAQANTSSTSGIVDVIGSYASDYVGSGSSTGSGSGGLGDIIGGLGGSGGLGDIVGELGGSGGIGDIIGNIGNDSDSANATQYTGNYETINPVVTAAPIANATTLPTTLQPGETVGASTKNPYTKPLSVINPGDRSDGVRWMQWIFIFTQYGLRADGITGEYDDATVEMVKKLQKEKGLPVDGIVSLDTIEKIDLLYYEFVYGADTTARFVEPSATVPVTASEKSDGSASWGWIAFIILASWVLVAAIIALILTLRKKKLSRDLKAFEEKENASTDGETDESASEPVSDFEKADSTDTDSKE